MLSFLLNFQYWRLCRQFIHWMVLVLQPRFHVRELNWLYGLCNGSRQDRLFESIHSFVRNSNKIKAIALLDSCFHFCFSDMICSVCMHCIDPLNPCPVWHTSIFMSNLCWCCWRLWWFRWALFFASICPCSSWTFRTLRRIKTKKRTNWDDERILCYFGSYHCLRPFLCTRSVSDLLFFGVLLLDVCCCHLEWNTMKAMLCCLVRNVLHHAFLRMSFDWWRAIFIGRSFNWGSRSFVFWFWVVVVV